MIRGIGIDMIEVDRVGGKISKENGFREMVFSPSEIDYCESKANPQEHYAARFAAKEAFFKALGSGWKSQTAFHEVEVSHDGQGKPMINLLGQSARTLEEIAGARIFVSLSHLKRYASAIVIIEQ